MNRAQKRAQEKAQKKQQQQMLSTAQGCNHVALQLMQENPVQAHELFQRAIMMEPEPLAYWINYHEVLKRIQLKEAPQAIEKILVTKLDKPSPIADTLVNIAQFFVTINRQIRESMALPAKEVINHPVKHPLLLTLLAHHIITSPVLEQWLTKLRGKLLFSKLTEEQKRDWQEFLKALAAQCFRNEYVFWQSDEEIERVKALNLRDEWEYSLAACYGPVDRKEQLQKEKEAAASIPRLTEISDAVSQKVQEQYEENPYPRWDKMWLPEPRPVAEELQRILPEQPSSVFAGLSHPPQLLVAGCGTGKHAAQVAARYKDSQIVAVDLSSASLGYAKGKLEEHGFADRVELMQADILELGKLDRQFDMIESTGVLHHMQDPIAGWKMLLSLLKPQGLMKIALYSELARQLIVKAREIIAQKGYEPTPQGIRQCRRDMMLSPDANELAELVRMPDFYSLSECRDLIFHVQEHRYTIPQLQDILEELSLEFLGFEHAMQVKDATYAEHYPHDRKQTNLNHWHELEQRNSLLFYGMYQMWLRPKS